MNAKLRPQHLISAIGLSTIGLVLVIAGLRSLPTRSVDAAPILKMAAWTTAPSYPNCRFGIGQGGQADYDVAPLNIGWYLDWNTAITPLHPNHAEYMQVVRLQPAIGGGFTFLPPTATLQAAVLANPGATWLIGNEPDSPWQDNMPPELYARAYQHLYGLIKGLDPTAQLGAGGIVQPTPLRFQYLDRVLAAYRAYYSTSLPADLWNIHSYILREITDDDPEAINNGGPYEVWGAYVPPGINATRGELYPYSQMFDPAIFRQRLITFRQWMAQNGYGRTPLYLTEFGTLFPYPPYDTEYYVDEYGVPMTEARTAQFMTQTFNVLMTLTDTVSGYWPDGQRLVQRWAWYSLNDPWLGGILFDPGTQARRPLGDVFVTYTNQLPPSVDLIVHASSSATPWTGQPITFTLEALLGNTGNISASVPLTVTFFAGLPGNGTPVGSVRVPAGVLHGCGGSTVVSTGWEISTAGVHPFYVEVDATHVVSESAETNNIATGWALASTWQIYLPVVER